MPMSSRKNLSNTIRKLRDLYESNGEKLATLHRATAGRQRLNSRGKNMSLLPAASSGRASEVAMWIMMSR